MILKTIAGSFNNKHSNVLLVQAVATRPAVGLLVSYWLLQFHHNRYIFIYIYIYTKHYIIMIMNRVRHEEKLKDTESVGRRDFDKTLCE